jgi:hypothetical protein
MKLKNRTITQKKVERNTLGGAVTNESRLGQVPSAAEADNAAIAANARACGLGGRWLDRRWSA